MPSATSRGTGCPLAYISRCRSMSRSVKRSSTRTSNCSIEPKYLRRAVAVLEADLVGAGGPARAVVEVDEEVVVDLHASVRVAVHAQEPRAQPGVELVVPGRVERVGDVEPAPVEDSWSICGPPFSSRPASLGLPRMSAEPELTGQLRIGRVGDVVLAQVAVQPVREVEEAVVHREDEVGDQAGHREGPALELDALDRDHLLGGAAAVRRDGIATSCWRAQRRRSPAPTSGSWSQRTSSGMQPALAEVDRLLERSLGEVPEVEPAARSGPPRRRPRSKPFSYAFGSPNSDETRTFFRGWYQKS